VEVQVNGTSYTITIDADLQDGAITLVNCDALNAYYINYIVVNCSNAELAASSAACEESQTETVVASTVSLSLAGDADTTTAELEAALTTEESQAALIASLAESLGIDPNRITIIDVTVTEARRMLAGDLRHLTSTSFNVELDYEVETDSSINDTSTLQESMTAIGETGSNQSSTFSTALVTNLEAAVDATDNITSVLATVVEVAKEQGISVAVVEAPTIVTREITTTTTTTTIGISITPDPSSSGGTAGGSSAALIIVLVSAAVVGLGLLGCGACYVRRSQRLPQFQQAGIGILDRPAEHAEPVAEPVDVILDVEHTFEDREANVVDGQGATMAGGPEAVHTSRRTLEGTVTAV